MKSKIPLFVITTLLALSIVVPVVAKPNMYLEMQCEITGMALPTQGNTFDVRFEGVAGGPDIVGGTVEGVDHVLIDAEGTHLNVYYTVTDKYGDKISAHVEGLSVVKNPGLTVFVGATATVISTDEYPTTGKFLYLYTEGTEFRDEGFLTAVKFDPLTLSISGRIHAKWYWD